MTKGKLASGSVVPRPEILKQRRVPLPLIGIRPVDAPYTRPKVFHAANIPAHGGLIVKLYNLMCSNCFVP